VKKGHIEWALARRQWAVNSGKWKVDSGQ
jgi:hypothetical protein